MRYESFDVMNVTKRLLCQGSFIKRYKDQHYSDFV